MTHLQILTCPDSKGIMLARAVKARTVVFCLAV